MDNRACGECGWYPCRCDPDVGPGLTRRAAAALKPFMDEAFRLERYGFLRPVATRADPLGQVHRVSASFLTSQWEELLAAFRESQRVVEGVTGGAAE